MLFLPKKSDNRKTLVLDLDETLVHSDFNPFPVSDVILKVEFNGSFYDIHVLIRPGVKEFLDKMSKIFEIVVFTASLAKYAEPLLDILDQNKAIKYRLSREHCTSINGIFVKELKRLNRDLKDVIIVDNSPVAYAFNPANGLPIKSWYNSKEDIELTSIVPLLEYLATVDDVRRYIPKIVSKKNEILYSKADEIIALSKAENEINECHDSKNTKDNDINQERERENSKSVYIANENQPQNSINSLTLNKEAKSTKNKNCLNLVPIGNLNNNVLEKNNNFYETGDQTNRKTAYLNNIKKIHIPQITKSKLTQYTSLLDRRELLYSQGKLNPSISTKTLRENTADHRKTLFRSPTSISIPSLTKNAMTQIKHKTNSSKIDHRNTVKFQCFLPKTTHNKGNAVCNDNCLECYLNKNSFANSTRNSKNTMQLGLFFSNKYGLKK